MTLKGVEPSRLSAIAPIDQSVVEGEPRLALNDVLIGRKLAQDLGIGVGQPIFIASDQGRERTLTVRGLYATGVDSLDARLAYVNLDRENADQVYALMTEIQRDTGTTFLLSTHDRELAGRCGRRIYIRGVVVVDGPAATEAATAPSRAAAAGTAAAPPVPAATQEADPVRAPAAARAPWRVIKGDELPVIDRTVEARREYGDDDDATVGVRGSRSR